MLKTTALTLLAFMCLAQTALGINIEVREYRDGHMLRAILIDKAENLKDPNCIRKWINTQAHKANVAIGCRIDSISILQSSYGEKHGRISVSPHYTCEEKNFVQSVGLSCKLKQK